MRIKINHFLDQLSAVRGIGSYQQMLQEAIKKYGSKQNLYLDDDNPDIYLITDFNFFLPIKTRPKLRQIAIIHDLIPIKYPRHFPAGIKGKIIWWQNRRQLSRLSGIITDSKTVKQELINFLSLKESQIEVVYPAAKQIFEQHLQAEKPNFAQSLPKEFILYTGDITWNKNLPRLGKAIKQLDKPLVLAGKALVNQKQKSHPWLQSYFEFLRETANDKRFNFLGYVSDHELLWLYQNAKVLALPSLAEGFGLTWLEASWQGTPCVVGKDQLTKEIMGATVFYCDPYSENSIFKALSAAWTNHKERSQLLAQAKRYSQANFVASLQKALYNLLDFHE